MTNPVALADADDEKLYGGKCVSLGRALRAGLPTPGGYALEVALVNDLVANGLGKYPRMQSVFDELAPAMAVRSSAVGEDSDEASFAGQHATVLNVMSMQSMFEAICEVHASARTPEALAYREKMNISGEPAIAIAVQKQIFSEVAGVMFTRNPISGEQERYIEASWGLGEAIVAGLVIPDSFRISPQGEVLERTAGEKDIKLVADPAGNAIEVDVEVDQVEALCLSDENLQNLHLLADKCEAVYGPGLDIEWALADERLYLLQCRAITK